MNRHLSQWSLVGALLLCCVLPGRTAATVGGPSDIEVLGHDPADHKLYILHTNHDASDRPPRLQYFLLASDDPHRAIPVKSWYEGEDQGTFDEATFRDRLAKLRTRLTPPELVPLAGLELIQHILRVEPCHPEFPDLHGECQTTDVQLRLAGRSASLQTRGLGRGRVVELWKIPGTEHLLAVFRHLGHVDEGGYDMDQLVFFGPAEKQ